MARLGWIGLGRRGTPMAELLAAAGHTLVTYDADPARNTGGAKSAAEVAAASEHVFLCVTDTEAVAAIAADIARVDGRGKLLVDHSTIDPEGTRVLAAKLRAANAMGWVDAPTSGPLGSCAVFLGGEAEDIARVRPFLDAYAGLVTHIGPLGSGQLVKLASQHVIHATVEAWEEAFDVLRARGVDPAKFFAACEGAGSDSAARRYFGPRLLKGGVEPATRRNFAKELAIWRGLGAKQ